MKIIKPKPDETVTITSTPEWPSLKFETDANGPHVWRWTLAWDKFEKSGVETGECNFWDANAAITNCGGTLTVKVEANKEIATIAVKIRGTNPTAKEVTDYLAKKANSAGFEKIIGKESEFIHFKKSEPNKSFDGGYGICQLTNPKPTFEQAWNWQLNIDAGLKLFEEKRLNAVAYLGKDKNKYTAEQLKYETVSRWNGGSYHEWDAKAGKWIRHPNILCDSKTGNIGWDMNDPRNKGKTENELHERDKGTYKKRKDDSPWKYLGVCYADRLLG